MRNGIALSELWTVIHHTREQRGISLRVAARQIGTSSATLSRIEAGRLPMAGDLYKLATWLMVPIVIAPLRRGRNGTAD